MHRNVKRVIIVSVVAIIGGLGYYLVSPLFLNTIVNESSPVQLVRDNQVDLPEEALGNDIVGILISGSFVGADDFHSSSGEALVVRSDSGELFLRFENFEVRNGPDLYVYLARSTDIGDGFVNLGLLTGNIGDQNYEVSSDVEISEFNTVLIWCRAFGVLFGSAEMS